MRKLLFYTMLYIFVLAGILPAKTNFVVILLDDFGYGDASCYNEESKVQTPNIDKFCQSGMKFTDMHCTGSYCIPSRYGLLTGRYPADKFIDIKVIDKNTQTMASVLKKAGYKTAMIGKWHNGFPNISIEDKKGFSGNLPESFFARKDNKIEGGPHSCGFDYFWGLPYSLDFAPYIFIENDKVLQKPTQDCPSGFEHFNNYYNSFYDNSHLTNIQGAFWRNGKKAPDFKHEDVVETICNKAIDCLKNFSKSSEPFLLYIPFTSPHTPWLPKKEFIGKSNAGMYGDFIVYSDYLVGKILDTIKELGLDENTLIIIASDNGPTWYPKDTIKYGHSASGKLRGMKADAWEGGHRIPFIVSWKGKVLPNSVCTETLGFLDVMPTFAQIANAKIDETIDGVSFLSLLENPKSGKLREYLIHNGVAKAIRYGKYKFINSPYSGGFSKYIPLKDSPPYQLYDLEEDISEQHNIASQNKELCEKFIKILKEQNEKNTCNNTN